MIYPQIMGNLLEMETFVIWLSYGLQKYICFIRVINIMGKQIIGFVWKNKGKHFIFLTESLEHFGSVNGSDIRNWAEMYTPEREKYCGMILIFRVRMSSVV